MRFHKYEMQAQPMTARVLGSQGKACLMIKKPEGYVPLTSVDELMQLASDYEGKITYCATRKARKSKVHPNGRSIGNIMPRSLRPGGFGTTKA